MSEYVGNKAYVNQTVAESYEDIRFHSSYGRYLNQLEVRIVQFFIKNFNKSGIILDLAGGTGRFSRLAISMGFRVVCTDISLNQLKVSVRNVDKTKGLFAAVVADAENLPFKDYAFAGIISVRFFTLLPPNSKRRVLMEMSRVGRQWALIHFSNWISVSTVRRVAMKIIGRHDGVYPVVWRAFKKDLSDAGYDITGLRRPLILPPRHFPQVLLKLVRYINHVGDNSPLGYFSEQSFALLENHSS